MKKVYSSGLLDLADGRITEIYDLLNGERARIIHLDRPVAAHSNFAVEVKYKGQRMFTRISFAFDAHNARASLRAREVL